MTLWATQGEFVKYSIEMGGTHYRYVTMKISLPFKIHALPRLFMTVYGILWHFGIWTLIELRMHTFNKTEKLVTSPRITVSIVILFSCDTRHFFLPAEKNIDSKLYPPLPTYRL